MKRVTYKDIADKLGISKAAVGYALNHSPKVSKKTAKLVIKTAKEMGHRPDPALAALAKHRWGDTVNKGNTYSIAVIVISVPKDRDTDEESMFKPTSKIPAGIYHNVYQTMKEQSEAHGFIFNLYICFDSSRIPDLARILYQKGTDGVIFHNNAINSKWKFPVDRFSSVIIGQSNPNCLTHNISPDWFGSMRLAVEECIAKGYERIGFTCFQGGAADTQDRLEAGFTYYRDMLSSTNSLPIFKYPLEHPTNFENEAKRFKKWFQKHKPDIVIDSNRFAYWWLDDMGFKVPERISLLHIGLNSDPRYNDVSYIDFHTDSIGTWSVNLISRLIQMNERGLPSHPIRVTVSCHWNQAGSTPKRKKK